MSDEVQADPVTKVARDLTEIVAMTLALDDQAEHKANDRIMPGGLAMVALAGVANLEAWEHQYEAREHFGREHSHVEDEDDTWEPPLQTLCFWSEQWRREHGAEYDRRPTVATEANFLRYLLDWAWDNEPHWDDFAADVRRARVRIENVLYAGTRIDLSRVQCSECDAHPRLIRSLGEADDGSEDRWKCPNGECRARYDHDSVIRAFGRQLLRAEAEKYVRQADAIATLKGQGIPERTLRRWLEAPIKHVEDICQECGRKWPPSEHAACPGRMADGDVCGGLLDPVMKGDPEDVVQSHCELGSRRVWVWWPDMWQRYMRRQQAQLERQAREAKRAQEARCV